MHCSAVKTILRALAILLLFQGSYANLDIVTLLPKGDNWIQEANATLVLGDIPLPQTGDLFLWSAILMDYGEGDFIQGISQSSEAYGKAAHSASKLNE
jgi:hypothetical protein